MLDAETMAAYGLSDDEIVAMQASPHSTLASVAGMVLLAFLTVVFGLLNVAKATLCEVRWARSEGWWP